ncbi:hypothetical protein [Fontibacillus sp. BL9]|uniref:hypothetical protein n=1 Tax=Fontibacillus sp. BL9 TaxID=3389971 RepID=UPI00397E7E92
MTCKLVMIEGLPGSGKSTHAQWTREILTELGQETRLYLEGNLEHPADYDGVACYESEEFRQLLTEQEDLSSLLEKSSVRRGDRYFIPYRKLREEAGADFPDLLAGQMFQHDVYELPFDRHAEVLTEKWREYGQEAEGRHTMDIFECCFLQNPLTVGLIKYDVPKQDIRQYVRRLEESILKLDPVVIYIDQQAVDRSFRKAVDERPREWCEGFIEYYTGQGFGKNRGLTGLEGTIEILRYKREFTLELLESLRLRKIILNNTAYDPVKSKAELRDILESLVVSKEICDI